MSDQSQEDAVTQKQNGNDDKIQAPTQSTSRGSSILSKFVAWLFASIFTFVGLLLASHQFFEFEFLAPYIKADPQAKSQIAMFGMLIFGVGFALLLTQFFAEQYSVAWKGVTFAGTLAAILIFIWIVRLVLLDPIIKEQQEQIGSLQNKNVELVANLATTQERVKTLRSNFLIPKDLHLTINCERSQGSQSLETGHRVQLLAISSRGNPSGRQRISEIVDAVKKLEESMPEEDRRLVSDEVRKSRFQQVEKEVDILFMPKAQGGDVSYFVPSLLSVKGQDIQIRLINADPADGSVAITNPAYSDLLKLHIRNPDDLSAERQEVFAELRFSALAEFCNVEGRNGG